MSTAVEDAQKTIASEEESLAHAKQVLADLQAPAPVPPPPTPSPTTLLMGANILKPPQSTTTEGLKEIDVIAGKGAKATRVSLEWNAVEWTKGTINAEQIAKYDARVKEAVAKGLKIILTISASPAWASSGGQWDDVPDISAYAAFCKKIAERYQALYPGWVDIELWNEPNWTPGLLGAPVSREQSYAEMVIAAYNAVHPTGVKVIAGAFAYSDTTFLAGCYGHGMKGHYDYISIHPYADGAAPGNTSVGHSFQGGIEKMINFLAANNDPVELVIGEFGWKAEGEVSSEAQAKYIHDGFEIAKKFNKIAMCIQWATRDPGGEGTLEYGFGMVKRDFTARPSLQAFGEAMVS